MLTLFGNLDSGNVHKVQMILGTRGLPFCRVDVRQDRGEPRHPAFLKINPMGKVPALILENGDILTESGAMLFYFARGTPLWPDSLRRQTEVLRWMFFEQYSHEPALAVLRYLKLFSGSASSPVTRIAELEQKSKFVLDILNDRLKVTEWIVGPEPTIADYALYPYTRLAEEVDLPAAGWPRVLSWLTHVEGLPGVSPVYHDAAVEVVPFTTYFAAH
jgi:glutathione S-transferase